MDSVDVNDGFSVEAEKCFGVEQAFELVESIIQDMPLFVSHLCEKQTIFGIEILNGVYLYIGELLANLHDEPFLVFRNVEGLDQVFQRLGVQEGGLPKKAVKFCQGLFEFLWVDRFQQIVNAVEFEGLERILVVGGSENNRRLYLHFPKNIKAQPVCQLNVEEHQVWPGVVLKPLDGLFNAVDERQYISLGAVFLEQLL